MLGLEGAAVPAGFVLTILSAVACVVYGIVNWNRGHLTDEEFSQELEWCKEESRVEETL